MKRILSCFIFFSFLISISSEVIGDYSHDDSLNFEARITVSLDHHDQVLSSTDCHNDCESEDCEDPKHCIHHCHGAHNLNVNSYGIKVRAPHCISPLCLLEYCNGYCPPNLENSKKPPRLS